MPPSQKVTAFLLCILIWPATATAAPEHVYTASLLGPLGLNTVPSARMQKSGTVSAGVSTLDPYVHGWLGFQITAPLYINIRQTAEVSNINDDPDRLYPGVDLKLRLLEESRLAPEIALGLNSAIGHKRMAGEYLALSKRWNDFDFTLGIGWGRTGSASHIDNPLKIFGNHFGKERSLDGEMPNEPNDWFTGKSIGFFGGVEYFTPVDGLSLKFDYGADRYEAEKAAFGFDAPAPWSVGAVYRPVSWIDMGIAAQGTDKIMGRLSLHTPLKNWPLGYEITDDEDVVPMRPYRTGLAVPAQMELSAAREAMLLYGAEIDNNTAAAMLDLDPSLSAPAQYGRAVKHIANHAGPKIEEIRLTPAIMNLRGPSVRLLRRDFEQALTRDQGSPQEIWRSAEFSDKNEHQNNFNRKRTLETKLILDNELGLSEEDNGFLYRTSLIVETFRPHLIDSLTAGGAVRINLKDNLEKLDEIRFRPLLPVRSDIDDFTDQRIGIDRSYLSWTHSFNPELHLAATAGYLEEMYAGAGGEILYRPFGPRFALGADLWQVFKRDPDTSLALGLGVDHLMTGHINGWYDIPKLDVTLQARLGRYLAEDIGGTLALHKNFDNGAQLEGFVTVTDQADFDLFGGTTHAYHGVRLTLPIGRVVNSERLWAMTRLKAAPFGRDTGQALDKPFSLYEVTEPFSYDHIARNWSDIVPAKKEPP